MHNIALKSSNKINIAIQNSKIEKDKLIIQMKAQMGKDKLEKEILQKNLQELKKQAEKELVLQFVEQGQKVAEVAEHVEKYYIGVVKDLKEYFQL